MARSASASSSKSPFWSGFIFGLVAGVVLAVVVALLVTKNNPFVSSTEPAPTQPSAKPVKPAESPTYDFYKTLPANTGSDVGQPPAAPSLWLQAGAFSQPEDADNLKARLALLGVEAAIESADVPDKGTLYRVRIGPLKDAAELDAMRKRLSDNAIPAEPVKK